MTGRWPPARERLYCLANYANLSEVILPIYAPKARHSAIIFAMDATDRKILAELQAEGRLTVTDLAQRASAAPCHRRLRELERTGAIRGYRAIIDPAAVGLGFEVLASVTMDREDAATITEFEHGLAGIPEVRHAERLFGDPDYLVRVATADLAAYQALRDEKLAHLARRAEAHLDDRDETHRGRPALPHLVHPAREPAGLPSMVRW